MGNEQSCGCPRWIRADLWGRLDFRLRMGVPDHWLFGCCRSPIKNAEEYLDALFEINSKGRNGGAFFTRAFVQKMRLRKIAPFRRSEPKVMRILHTDIIMEVLYHKFLKQWFASCPMGFPARNFFGSTRFFHLSSKAAQASKIYCALSWDESF